MDAIAPSVEAVVLLRGISIAGFAYERVKELGKTAGWRLVDDEPDLGYVAFEMDLVPDTATPRRVSIEIKESGRSPRAFIPLFYFEDYDTQRTQFDDAFRSIRDQLVGFLGPPSAFGEYDYPHRKDWIYSYSRWSDAEATFILVQDEFDIQFGMDVSLWVLPSGVTIELPVNAE